MVNKTTRDECTTTFEKNQKNVKRLLYRGFFASLEKSTFFLCELMI